MLVYTELWFLSKRWGIPQLQSHVAAQLNSLLFCTVADNALKAACCRVFESVVHTELQPLFVRKMINYAKADSKIVRGFVGWFPLCMLQQFTLAQFDIIDILEGEERRLAQTQAKKSTKAVNVPVQERPIMDILCKPAQTSRMVSLATKCGFDF